MTFPINLIFTIHTNNNEKYNNLPEGLILYPTIFLMHELPIYHNYDIAIYADDY